MEALQHFWSSYGQVIMGVLGSGIGAAIIAFIARFCADRLSRKLTSAIDVKRVVEEVTQKVTENLSGSIIDVDISAVLNEQAEKIFKEIIEKADLTEEAVNTMRMCVALMSQAIAKSKLLEEAERQTLLEEAEKLGESVARAEKPVTKVLIMPKKAEEPQKVKAEEKVLDFEGVKK